MPMLKGISSKNVMLIYAVIGFGTIALVALGELSGVEVGSSLYDFYLKLVFGGFVIFYAVLIHFALLPYSQRLDSDGPKILRYVLGESSSRVFIFTLTFLVLVYWILAFADLMQSSGFRFFQ